MPEKKLGLALAYPTASVMIGSTRNSPLAMYYVAVYVYSVTLSTCSPHECIRHTVCDYFVGTIGKVR